MNVATYQSKASEFECCALIRAAAPDSSLWRPRKRIHSGETSYSSDFADLPAELFLSSITSPALTVRELLSNIYVRRLGGFGKYSWHTGPSSGCCSAPLLGLPPSSLRNRLRALCNWDFEFPIEYPKMRAISLWP
jgi:hypothetical protein